MAVPNIFATATSALPLSQLDANFSYFTDQINVVSATGITITGKIGIGAGTLAAPSIYLSTDTGTGFYRIGANNNGYSVSGTKLLDFSSALFAVTGAATVSTTLGVTGATTLSSTLALGGTVSGGGNQINNVIIGTSTPLAGFFTTLSGSSTFAISGTGPHVIGGATNANRQLNITGAFVAGAGGEATSLWVDPTVTPNANGNSGIFRISGTLVEAGSGTHGLFYGTAMVAPTITAGAASVTTAATLYIDGPPAASGASNYSLYVGTGVVRINGTTGAGASVGTVTNAPSAGNPAYWMPINANGSTYYIPCWS